MVLSNRIISDLTEKSGLLLDRATDFAILADQIFSTTKQTIGVTTLKRLTGYIDDPRETNKGTLNILAVYLGYPSWDDYMCGQRMDSDWNVESDVIWIASLEEGTSIEVSYLNRGVSFIAINTSEGKALRVTGVRNSSLRIDDIAFIDRIRKGEKLEARKVCRGKENGSYRTNGEVKSIIVNKGK